MDSPLKPVYGWAMNFGKGYKTQSNIFSTSSVQLPKYPQKCNQNFYTDGRYMNQPPFYSLGPHPYPSNCPFYNYTLPDTYPNVPSPMINPKAYWYLPYNTFDWQNYNASSIVKVPKPGY
jgi:hypothetical protein